MVHLLCSVEFISYIFAVSKFYQTHLSPSLLVGRMVWCWIAALVCEVAISSHQ